MMPIYEYMVRLVAHNRRSWPAMGIEAIPSYNFRMDTINLGWMYEKYIGLTS